MHPCKAQVEHLQMRSHPEFLQHSEVLSLPVMCDERLSQPQLAEHVYYCLHGSLISHGDGRHVQDFLQLQRRRTCCLGRS